VFIDTPFASLLGAQTIPLVRKALGLVLTIVILLFSDGALKASSTITANEDVGQHGSDHEEAKPERRAASGDCPAVHAEIPAALTLSLRSDVRRSYYARARSESAVCYSPLSGLQLATPYSQQAEDTRH
jgi:hypothetical protein